MQQINPPERALADFTTFLDSCQRPLHTFLRGLVSDDEQARDLMQDAFCDAWKLAQRGQAPFTGPERVNEQRRWLFHAAYNRAISALRRRKLIRWFSLEQTEGIDLDISQHASSFEDQFIESEAVRVALAGLSAEDRSHLLLIIVYGFTTAEAGRIIGVSTQAMARRFARARKRFRDVYLARNTPLDSSDQLEKRVTSHVQQSSFSN